MSKSLLIERYIQQVTHGTAYKGDLTIGETKLEYNLLFTIPINGLDNMQPPKSEAEIRQTFQITVKKDGAPIELTFEEYGLFFQLLVDFAVEFYNNPQTQDSNEGILGFSLRGEGIFQDAVRSTIGMTSRSTYNLTPELCAILNAPKFDCSLPT
ncbi:MAG TPA: hypothetical protein VEA59_06395 [Patescibacteria group bacterium]|nr:hypothetical protein [Patescibacteria group bacterium]